MEEDSGRWEGRTDADDEDIDSDEAFGSGDDEKYGDVLASILSRRGKGKKRSQGADEEDEEDDLEEESGDQDEGDDDCSFLSRSLGLARSRRSSKRTAFRLAAAAKLPSGRRSFPAHQ